MVASVMMAEKIQEDRVVTEYHGLRGNSIDDTHAVCRSRQDADGRRMSAYS
jgi:hypothetical protein